MSVARGLAIRLHVRDELSPRMLRARAACLQAQAHLDALSGDPADRAWAEVMDAFFTWVSEVPAPAKA